MTLDPSQYTNIVELLSDRAARHPERTALTFLGDGENVTRTFTYGSLNEHVRAVGARLAERAAPGDRALLLFPNGPDYVVSFLACLYAGLIAVPAYPPPSNALQHWSRLVSMAKDAAPRLVLTESALLPAITAAQGMVPELAGVQGLATDEVDLSLARSFQFARPRPEQVALLQYTSGSTAVPKGVMVSHANIVAGERAIEAAFSMNADDVVVSWLPLFHDMGLIGTLLQPLYQGVPGVLLAPQHFMERPERWLHAISRHRGTVSGAPDFAYRLAALRVDPRAQQGLDLSSWRLAFCGAEPIRHETLSAFSDKFAAAGFDAGALYPCYGLAESTLLVTGGRRGEGARAARFDARALGEGRALEADGPASSQALVNCGKAQPEHDVVVVHVDTAEPVGDGEVGEIRVAGPSVTQGYWNNAEATAQTFFASRGRTWLRTGDLGFMRDGELFVTGRQKDLIIVRGHNLYPQDIERSVEDGFDVVRKGRTIAFAWDESGEESIAVAAEVNPRVQKLIDPEAVCRSISERVAAAHGEPARLVLLLNPGAVPITSSGKLMRAACRKSWQKKKLDTFAVFELPAPRAKG
ncbi:MAG TPA: AMP-binding protein [Polyangiaceae bacterium]|nr:AMP-binding protein [Polyangiaceae bacterium]